MLLFLANQTTLCQQKLGELAKSPGYDSAYMSCQQELFHASAINELIQQKY